MVKPNGSTLCTLCGEQTANYLLYYRKYHREIGNFSYVNPELACDPCRDQLLSISPELQETQPVWINFQALSAQPQIAKKIGYLTSKKGKESNQLANKFWRDKIWHMCFYHKGELKRAKNGSAQ